MRTLSQLPLSRPVGFWTYQVRRLTCIVISRVSKISVSDSDSKRKFAAIIVPNQSKEGVCMRQAAKCLMVGVIVLMGAHVATCLANETAVSAADDAKEIYRAFLTQWKG